MQDHMSSEERQDQHVKATTPISPIPWPVQEHEKYLRALDRKLWIDILAQQDANYEPMRESARQDYEQARQAFRDARRAWFVQPRQEQK